MKEVKLINFTATKFGYLKAIELDFSKFKNGVIAIKGNAGAGKSTIQNGLKTNIQGRNTLADADQYGDNWELETQLADGERKIFITAIKKDGKSIEYKLFEKDETGKKVFSPVIDGIKATPSKYMDIIANEMTFGIKDFLSEDYTTHKKFMFALFRDELAKLGVIFDKRHPNYKNTILGQLDSLTDTRDLLRIQCQGKGAFMEDFKRQGYKEDDLKLIQPQDIKTLENQKNNILIKKGQAESNSELEYEKERNVVAKQGQEINEKIRSKVDELKKVYEEEKTKYERFERKIKDATTDYKKIETEIFASEFITEEQRTILIDELKSYLDIYNKEYQGLKAPIMPVCPDIVAGKIHLDSTKEYDTVFMPLIADYMNISKAYGAIKKEDVKLDKFDNQIEQINKAIEIAKENNELFERFELNRQ